MKTNATIAGNRGTEAAGARKGPFLAWRKTSNILPAILAAVFAGQASPDARANPGGMTVVRGSAQATQNGSQLNITVSQNAFLNWNTFNIAGGETTSFLQPSAYSIVWNRIGDANASQIYGNLQANGIVVLANPSGFYFGPNAFVKAGGLFVTTAPIAPATSAGGPFCFSGPPPAIPIVNYGRLETAGGGPLFLIAKQIENHGTLSAANGTVGLVAGQKVLVSDRPDGRGLSVRVSLPQGTIDNEGRIVADAGRILVEAQTVNQGGLVEANSIRKRDGIIELLASDSIELGSHSALEAIGDAGSPSDGGQIKVKSDRQFMDQAGSTISAAGGANGGNGGRIELSAPFMGDLLSRVGAAAIEGWKAGTLLLDPQDISIGNLANGDSAGTGTIHYDDPPTAGALRLDVRTAFTGFSQIDLQATRDINVLSAWNLPTSTGKDAPGCQLTLEAGRDLKFAGAAQLLGGQFWSFALLAGADAAGGGGVVSGMGNVVLTGGATIQTGLGSIDVLAGNNVTVANGAIRTVGGGNVSVQALAGSVNAGANPSGLIFGSDGVGYVVDPNLGGISTMAGGDVFIKAGQDVKAFKPPQTGNGVKGEAGIGAFGADRGDVTIEAVNGNVTGHYLVRNGAGKITADNGSVGTGSGALALSLVKGSWSVNAPNGSILLEEVRNPNGIFNDSGSLHNPNPFKYLFDYDPAAAVHLNAGKSVELTGSTLPRGNDGLPSIYPPTLSISAGAGGVIIDNPVYLFPSAVGNLTIETTDGGNLGVAGLPSYLTMSDSSRRQWTKPGDFTASDRGNNTLHLNDPDPVFVDVSGSVFDFTLTAPKPVSMHVAKDMSGGTVSAQNFHATDRTTISVGGKITFPNWYTFVYLPAGIPAPDFNVLNQAVGLGDVRSRLTYNASLRRLVFAGPMTDSDRIALENIQILDPLDPQHLRLIPATFVDARVIEQLYAVAKDTPNVLQVGSGFYIGGPGALDISATSLDLGATYGIQSLGIAGNPALFPLTKRGADINVTLHDDLDMLSSSILSAYGGKIRIKSGGSINLGLPEGLGGGDVPRGIISLWGGDIEVEAFKDVEVNGSRIAAYDGGSIDIESLTGNVDAGTGGSGFVQLHKPYWDPVSGTVRNADSTIPGSGILATSSPFEIPGQPAPRVGSISVTTPKGDIIASAGGIVQLDLSGHAKNDASITLTAGSTDPDGTVHKGNIQAGGSGVIGDKVDLKATGDITGLVVAQGDLNIGAGENVNVIAIGQGNVVVKSDTGNVKGTIVGVGAVSVSGANIDANVVTGPGQANVSGNVTGTGAPAAAAPVASTASQAISSEAQATAAQDQAKTDEENKRRKQALLAKHISRVTVILPGQL